MSGKKFSTTGKLTLEVDHFMGGGHQVSDAGSGLEAWGWSVYQGPPACRGGEKYLDAGDYRQRRYLCATIRLPFKPRSLLLSDLRRSEVE